MALNKTRIIRKFNPGVLQSDAEVIEQFVVRNHELKTVLTLLRDNIDSPSCQHALIIAPRGQGKTMLLARTEAELRSNKEFSQYLLPVRFIEESQEIFTMADFWLETLYHLAIECKRVDRLLAEELHMRHIALSKNWSNDTLEEHAKIAVLDAADQIGRKLVLMVENLQSLSKAVDEGFGWELRQVLQSEPQIILLASATIRFAGIDKANQPFFELFRIIKLQPLNTDECRSYWNFLTGDDFSSRNIRPLEILTGGNPRLIVILASFAQHMSLSQLMEELVLMIDEFTDYFRGNLDSLAKTERRVFIAVIDLWSPSTPGEISIRARMNIRKVSTMLGRLIEREAVIPEGNGRRRKYSASERIYSIYYKLRRNRDEASIVQALIRFMSSFYTDAEQKEIFSAMIEEVDEFPAIGDGFHRALNENPEIIKHLPQIHLEKIQSKFAPTSQKTLETKILEAFENSDFPQVIQIVDHALSSQCSATPESQKTFVPWALLMKGTAQQIAEDLDSALSTVEEIIEDYDTAKNNELQPLIARALIIKGEVLQAKLNLYLAPLSANKGIKHFGPVKTDSLRSNVPEPLTLNIGGELPDTHYDLESAVEAFDAAIERLDSVGGDEHQWHIAQALTNKGEILRASGQLERALTTFNDVVGRFRYATHLDLDFFVKSALSYLGEILYFQGFLEEALSIFEEVDDGSSENKNLKLELWTIWALVHKGEILNLQEKLESALSVYEKMVERYGDKVDPVMQISVEHALIHKGKILMSQGDFESALSVYEEVIERSGDKVERSGMQSYATPHAMQSFAEHAMQSYVACALLNKGEILKSRGELESAMSIFEEVVEHSGDRVERSGMQGRAARAMQNYVAHEMQSYAARALMNKGEILRSQGELKPALSIFEEVIERFGTSEVSELHMMVSFALVRKTLILYEFDDTARPTLLSAVEEAINYINYIDHSKVPTEMLLPLQKKLVALMTLRGSVLYELNRIEEATEVYDEVIERLRSSENRELQKLNALALVWKAELQISKGNVEDASNTHNEIIRRLNEFNLNEQGGLKWHVFKLETQILLSQSDFPAATGSFRSLYTAFKNDNEEHIRLVSNFAIKLVAGGVSPSSLLEILSSNDAHEDALYPLFTALRLEAGEEVHVPREIWEVASDIRKDFQKLRV